MTDHYDVVIVGSGAGGGTMAYALAGSGARILLLERGGFVPQEEENWDPVAVWEQRRYQTRERWADHAGRDLPPYTHYSVGGNTKFWGSVLFRLRREDFGALQHVDGVSPAWPIDYDTLAPYYDRAERLFQVRGQHGVDPTDPPRRPYPFAPVPHEGRMADIVAKLERQGLHPSPLPLGLLRPGEPDGCVSCRTCNSFPCRIHAKSDADVCCVRPAIQQPNVTLWTNALARRVLTDARGRRVTAVEVERNGELLTVNAGLVVVSCGAVNSAALLLRSSNAAHPNGLANSSGLVGRRYMAHLATMMEAVDLSQPNETNFSKTVAINDYYLRGPDSAYPLGQIQSQGRTHGLMAKLHAPWWGRKIPLWLYDWWVGHGFDWLVMTEDLPHAENRVTLDSRGRIALHYRQSNLRAHHALVDETKRILARLGLKFPVTHSHGSRNTTHQCGTVVFGSDPRESVLDPFCRAHDVDNLFVVDASFFPSSAAVNPGLTIIAQALRAADQILATELGQRSQVSESPVLQS